MNYDKLSHAEIEAIAKHFAASGMFTSIKSASAAYVKIMFGRDLGLSPMEAIAGISIYGEKPTLSATTQALLVKRSGKYDYAIVEQSSERCVIEWMQNGQVVGQSSYTLDDARQAGLLGKDQWKKYPSDLLFARALTRGIRRYAADALSGVVYTPEEMDDVQVVERPRLPPSSPEVMQSRAIIAETIDEGRRLTQGTPIPEVASTTMIDEIRTLAGILAPQEPHVPASAALQKILGRAVRNPEAIFDGLTKLSPPKQEQLRDALLAELTSAASELITALPEGAYTAMHTGICGDMGIDAGDPGALPVDVRVEYLRRLMEVLHESQD